MTDLVLDADAVAKTVALLSCRIEERFPGSGLSGVCRELDRITTLTRERAEWIGRPILSLRILVALLIAVIAAGLVNDVVLVGAGVFFLLTLETRIKRRRALEAIKELRAIAHIIDMHQLTKDPEWVFAPGTPSGAPSALLPERRFSRFQLSRYLDYCSEMLSITGKLAALYIQDFDDDVALAAVNEVENLTTGLARKIWQKLMILYQMGPEPTPASLPGTSTG